MEIFPEIKTGNGYSFSLTNNPPNMYHDIYAYAYGKIGVPNFSARISRAIILDDLPSGQWYRLIVNLTGPASVLRIDFDNGITIYGGPTGIHVIPLEYNSEMGGYYLNIVFQFDKNIYTSDDILILDLTRKEGNIFTGYAIITEAIV